VLGCAVMAKLEKRFVDLGESEAREVIKSAVAVGVFQGNFLLGLLVALFVIGLKILLG
jgi:hypothetical protein